MAAPGHYSQQQSAYSPRRYFRHHRSGSHQKFGSRKGTWNDIIFHVIMELFCLKIAAGII